MSWEQKLASDKNMMRREDSETISIASPTDGEGEDPEGEEARYLDNPMFYKGRVMKNMVYQPYSNKFVECHTSQMINHPSKRESRLDENFESFLNHDHKSALKNCKISRIFGNRNQSVDV